ncbi:MAG TPA: hypothetical protein VG758_21140 [Hyphomicrobiaceae bacterium]|jgi:hypothetical protein|nr:hypothetical protein [Hyphomicrobiaceae bacterium]
MNRKSRKLPPVKSTGLRRKGNHPSNPYPVPEAWHEDREGWPFPASRSPKAKPARAPNTEPDEPSFVLRASDPLAAIILRCWAGLSADFRLQHPDVVADARRTALGMDLWRSKNRGGTP